MSKSIFRVAILQECAAVGDFEKNTTRIIQEMEQAKDNQADILLLPECFITGYSMPILNSEVIDEDSIHIKRIRDKAMELKIGVVATAFFKGNEKARNTALVIDKQGKIIMRYDKVHTCDFADERCLESGEEFNVCEFDGVKIGIMICYDREYPESARILMLKGAELILVPNDCASMLPRLKALSTRAYENMVGIVMSNPPGDNCGNSCAYSPICWDENGMCVDNTILLADDKTSSLYFADFDIEKLREYRNREMLGNTFRKVKAYGKLLDTDISEPFIR